jgi:hypothetical protein
MKFERQRYFPDYVSQDMIATISKIVKGDALLIRKFFAIAMDTDDQDASKVIAAVCYANKTIGFACYNELSNTIFADSVPVSFEDMEDVLAKIKSASAPTLFLIHPTILANSSLLDLLICGIDGTPNAYRL